MMFEHYATFLKRDPEIIFGTLENKLLELEGKSRLSVVKQTPTKLPKKDKMELKMLKRCFKRSAKMFKNLREKANNQQN